MPTPVATQISAFVSSETKDLIERSGSLRSSVRLPSVRRVFRSMSSWRTVRSCILGASLGIVAFLGCNNRTGPSGGASSSAAASSSASPLTESPLTVLPFTLFDTHDGTTVTVDARGAARDASGRQVAQIDANSVTWSDDPQGPTRVRVDATGTVSWPACRGCTLSFDGDVLHFTTVDGEQRSGTVRIDPSGWIVTNGSATHGHDVRVARLEGDRRTVRSAIAISLVAVNARDGLP